MIVNTDQQIYRGIFNTDPHPFISDEFIQLNQSKADKLVHLIQNTKTISMGLVAGIKNNVLLSPFSAPFGGFHFKNEIIYSSAIDQFLIKLKEYAAANHLSEINITLAPDIYSQSTNAKLVNSFIRMGYQIQTPDITNWIDLCTVQEKLTHPASRTYYNQALKKGLSFSLATIVEEKEIIYDLVAENRTRMERPIHMTFNNLQEISKVFELDYFKVTNPAGEIVAGAIFYRTQQQIAYAVFWGDSETGRPLRSMDFLVLELCQFYKTAGFKYIDLGKSTVDGIPNEGLLRFKETHECVSSIRNSFSWKCYSVLMFFVDPVLCLL